MIDLVNEQIPVEHGDGDADQDCVDKHPEGPDPCADEYLVECGDIFDDLAEGRGDECGDDEPHAFFDPYADDHRDASCIEEPAFSTCWCEEHDEGKHVECDSRPDPGDECVVAVESKEKILGRYRMRGAGVELCEDF